MSIWTAILFILVIATLIGLIVLYVIYFTKKTPTNQVTWTPIQGNASAPAFTGNSNTIYLVPNTFSGTITVNKPSGNISNTSFLVSNVANNQDITVTSTSGVSVVGGNVSAGTGAQFIWMNDSLLQRVM